jgi:hypothetical protein
MLITAVRDMLVEDKCEQSGEIKALVTMDRTVNLDSPQENVPGISFVVWSATWRISCCIWVFEQQCLEHHSSTSIWVTVARYHFGAPREPIRLY